MKDRARRALVVTLIALIVLVLMSYSSIGLSYNVAERFFAQMDEYKVDSSCPCKPRIARSLKYLNGSLKPEDINFEKITDGEYVGKSTCNQYTTALGAGQQVLSYSFYTPPTSKQGKPLEPEASILRYSQLMANIIQHAKLFYPRWRIRLYHNVTDQEKEVKKELCDLYCQNMELDLCDVTNLHSLGDLNVLFPVGRFWRFQAVGDPTVKIFASRDIDSYIQDREAFAVQDWLTSKEQFHVMRDAPFHNAAILAGLWGSKNYLNMTQAINVKRALFSVAPSLNKDADQVSLRNNVWPLISNNTVIHDSYGCLSGYMGPGWHPWPARRIGFAYVGYGPTKDVHMKKVANLECPLACRPQEHEDWTYC